MTPMNQKSDCIGLFNASLSPDHWVSLKLDGD